MEAVVNWCTQYQDTLYKHTFSVSLLLLNLEVATAAAFCVCVCGKDRDFDCNGCFFNTFGPVGF